MKRTLPAGMAALAIAGGITVATAIPSQADTTMPLGHYVTVWLPDGGTKQVTL